MPQMAPLMWLMLYMLFLMTFIIFIFMNHYNFTPRSHESMTSMNILTSTMNWKW
uniref:ATP synthase complex subunit 8 n=1 Tax=Petrobiellus sp. 2 JZ-2014 TaxID=1529459 RepID=A0A0B4N573_9INSE|nr:ATP synthase subunit 8 [Petrobiellus sp. 2 JZ-2014]